MKAPLAILAAAILSVPMFVGSAQAWIFEDDGSTWPVFSFHSYGGDVNRPAATPDRPYFHGDDAVPLSMRWRDLAAAEAAEAAASLEVGAAVVTAEGAVAPPPRRAVKPRRVVHVRRHRAVAKICVPASTETVAVVKTTATTPH